MADRSLAVFGTMAKRPALRGCDTIRIRSASGRSSRAACASSWFGYARSGMPPASIWLAVETTASDSGPALASMRVEPTPLWFGTSITEAAGS